MSNTERRARELFEEAEVRKLCSVWAAPSRFENCREYFMKKAREEGVRD